MILPSVTPQHANARRGLAARIALAKHPDFAIEVIWTRGGLDKLEVYRKLGVPEVWMLERGKLTFYVLKGSAWKTARRSAAVPSLDPSDVEAAMREETQVAAARRIRELVRAKK